MYARALEVGASDRSRSHQFVARPGAACASPLASAYAIVSHAAIFVPTTVLGLILLWSFGISFKRLSHLRMAEEPTVIP